MCDSGWNSFHGTLGRGPTVDSRDPARVADAPPLEPCPADLADVNTFTAAFLAMEPIADLNDDGLYDLSDINLFVTSFLAGCP